VLWKFSVSGLSTMLLLVIFLALAVCLTKIEAAARQELGDSRRLFLFALAAGAVTALGFLTRYSFGWLIVPVVVFLALYGGPRRLGMAVAAFLAFSFLVSPWIARNLAVSGTYFGTAGYAVVEGTFAFPGTRLLQSISPDLTSAYWLMPYERKFLENIRYLFQGELPRLGGWLGILFFVGLMIGFRNVAARRLRYFVMLSLGIFIIVQALGRTQLSFNSPEINSENLLVLLTPLVCIFGVVCFLTLVDQMAVPSVGVRFGVIGLLVLLGCQPLLATLLPPRPSPVNYPPYFPPDIQKVSGWMRPNELMMSDIPWAVAWYGDRQCTWTTINSQYTFFQLNDWVKPVQGLYLTLNLMDGKLFSDCLQGGVDSWNNFVFKTLVANQLPEGFPLQHFPLETLPSGMFLTDRARW
jgi:4-amino-4-deoxy-L-arabinose transferase-like glycosyltransferase